MSSRGSAFGGVAASVLTYVERSRRVSHDDFRNRPDAREQKKCLLFRA
jgi:hypothetical protein